MRSNMQLRFWGELPRKEKAASNVAGTIAGKAVSQDELGETSCDATEPPVLPAFSSSSLRLPMILAEICSQGFVVGGRGLSVQAALEKRIAA